MVLFLSWRQPSPQRQKACVDASGGEFNYDAGYRGASEGAASDEAEAALARGGFHVNRARVLLGSGADTFRRAKTALCAWRSDRITPPSFSLFFLPSVLVLCPFLRLQFYLLLSLSPSSSSSPLSSLFALVSVCNSIFLFFFSSVFVLCPFVRLQFNLPLC